jgi:hypothetical protein
MVVVDKLSSLVWIVSSLDVNAEPGTPGRGKVVPGPIISEGLIVKIVPSIVIVVGLLIVMVWVSNMIVEGPWTYTGMPAISPVVSGPAGVIGARLPVGKPVGELEATSG